MSCSIQANGQQLPRHCFIVRALVEINFDPMDLQESKKETEKYRKYR